MINKINSEHEAVDVSKFGYSDGFFRTWSPEAIKVEILFFIDSDAVKNNQISENYSLKKIEKGQWQTENLSETAKKNKYYKYRFTFENNVYEVCDIWSKCASADSVASQIADISYKKSYFNPFGNSGAENKLYSDAVIYEMHIRDWSRAFVKDSYGKYLEIADSVQFMEHLKELGITHVQILPCFDYASKNEDLTYNWGYDPFNYNVPEGRYVSNGYKDGTDAVFEFRKMIQAFHDNGIAVNMDVVYNHTNGTGEKSIYDMTVPGYFYRFDENGNYQNGSGCGNEIASNHKIVREFIIDSLKHWMKDFHINGFRFDLMGVFETSTMKEIYNQLAKIDPNVMVYGEPWCGGSCGVVNGCSKENIDDCCGSELLNGIACFNDNIRNAIKGPEFGGFGKGQVQGNFYDEAICTGLTGSLIKNSGFTKNICRSINYAECHDNYTLFDKLAISKLDKTCYSGNLFEALSRDDLETVKKWDKLCAAYVILSQGIPFINGGQEFLRTKQGNENSYNSCDEINEIDFSFKTKYSDIFNVYKGLIKLRKKYALCFGNNYDAQAITLACGVTSYKTGDFEIFFNASNYDYYAHSECKKIIDIDSGEISEKNINETDLTDGKIRIPANSYRILKF